MVIYVCDDYGKMSEVAANQFAAHLILKPNSVVGLATGSTPEGMYSELIEKYKKGEISFKNVVSFNLDEYIDLPKENENSYYTFMHEKLFDHVDIKAENINIPDGNVKDFEKYVKEYESKIESVGGIDLQILGIGKNAHIGFNEPDKVFLKKTSVVDLTQSTIDANSRFFDSIDEVPKKAISMGTGSIFKAKNILLLASGKSKAEAINNMINGEIDPQIPASILQLHSNVVLVIDKEAAELLDEDTYIRV